MRSAVGATRGFTLLEVLIAVSLLAALAGLVLPSAISSLDRRVYEESRNRVQAAAERAIELARLEGRVCRAEFVPNARPVQIALTLVDAREVGAEETGETTAPVRPADRVDLPAGVEMGTGRARGGGENARGGQGGDTTGVTVLGWASPDGLFVSGRAVSVSIGDLAYVIAVAPMTGRVSFEAQTDRVGEQPAEASGTQREPWLTGSHGAAGVSP